MRMHRGIFLLLELFPITVKAPVIKLITVLLLLLLLLFICCSDDCLASPDRPGRRTRRRKKKVLELERTVAGKLITGLGYIND